MKRLFWDIETTPCIGYFWRPSYRTSISYDNILEQAKIICISYKWQDEDEVHTLVWDGKDDKKLVKAFAKELKKSDDAVAHNGDRFDLPWVKTRFLVHGVDFPAKITTTDTLKRARGNFRFPSNRLNDIGEYLGLGKKLDTGGFGLWKDVMKGDEKALEKMVKYCEQDVLLLEKVYHKLKNHVPVTLHEGVYNDNKKWACPSCSSDKVYSNKKKVSPTGVIKREMKCKCCKRYYTISNKAYIDYLTKKA